MAARRKAPAGARGTGGPVRRSTAEAAVPARGAAARAAAKKSTAKKSTSKKAAARKAGNKASARKKTGKKTAAREASAPGSSGRRYWLMKSEPDVYSWDDLVRDGRTHWDGVRNYQARNLMRDEFRVGDGVLFYHSNADPMSIAGVARVVAEAYPDPSAFDPKSKYHDPGSDPEAPRWMCVDIAPVLGFDPVVTRDDLKGEPRLADMMVLQRGARLSVQPVDPAHWDVILELAGVEVDW